MKWDLVISLVEINLAEYFAPIKVGHYIIDGGNDVPFPDDGFFERAHVNTDSNFIWL